MPYSVAIALGSNLGNREKLLRRSIYELGRVIRVVRVSSFHETEPVDAPPESRRFLNAVVVGSTRFTPEELLPRLQEIERLLGRRRGVKNAPRTIDLDLILHSAFLRSGRGLTLPHPGYRGREFVMIPLRELRLPWRDPKTGEGLS